MQAYTKALGLNPRHKPTLDALTRLGFVATREETEVGGAGGDGWRVLQSGEQFVAVSNAMPKLRVPLEMLGKGQPRILRWERQKAPHAGFGILTFAAGQVETAPGQSESLEGAAIVDIAGESLLGLPLAKKGAKSATWTWDEGRLVVTSAEGLTEEYTLRGVKPSAVAAAPVEKAPRREGSGGGGSGSGGGGSPSAKSSGGVPAWAPWANTPPNAPPRQASRPSQPKSIFEMLFGK